MELTRAAFRKQLEFCFSLVCSKVFLLIDEAVSYLIDLSTYFSLSSQQVTIDFLISIFLNLIGLFLAVLGLSCGVWAPECGLGSCTVRT